MSKDTDSLLEVLTSIKDKTDIEDFLQDLLTDQELIEFSKRFQVAKLLSEGVSYSEIEKLTGLSSTTIARVSKSYNQGNGYKKIIKKLS